MKKNFLISSEIAGVFVVTLGVLFLWNLYELSGRSTIGVVFGAVNSSIWEKAKCVSICFSLWGLIELMCAKGSFHTLVVAKTAGLTVSLIVFIAAESVLTTNADFPILIVSVLCGFLSSCFLSLSDIFIRPFFAPACFLVLLIFLMTFSLTVFTPRLWLFRDPYTGYYGITPPSFDMGAVTLGI